MNVKKKKKSGVIPKGRAGTNDGRVLNILKELVSGTRVM